jgi:SNF2 family DNA or RNA helicase/uncharacterized Zn finger protein
MAKYGTTWWGNRWLEALQSIDYSNRIPRGKTYANTGKVKDIIIENGKIAAKVQGSERLPYKQVLSIPPFTDAQQQQIIEVVAEDPYLLSSLLNKELPQQIEAKLAEKDIYLFPKKWSDWTAKCSCPDVAVPCKHLAAVIYVLANEIDQNPFLLFQIKGMDLVKELYIKGYVGQSEIKSPVYDLRTVLSQSIVAQKIDTELFVKNTKKIDFSKIPQGSQQHLLQLLDNQQTFNGGKNIKIALEAAYQRIKGQAKKLYYHNTERQIITPNTTHIEVVLDKNLLQETVYISYRQEEEIVRKKATLIELATALQTIHPEHLSNYHIVVQVFYWVYQYALHLLTTGTFLPQVVQINDVAYKIRWTAAHMIAEVEQIYQYLLPLIPAHCLYVEKDTQPYYFLEQERLETLTATFISHFVRQICVYVPNQDAAAIYFFENKLIRTDLYESRELPFAINAWLQKYAMATKQYVPVIQLEEHSTDEFDVKFSVQDRKAKLGKPIPLSDIFSKAKYKEYKMSILQDFTLLAKYIPDIQSVLQSKGKEQIYIDLEQLPKLLFEIMPAVKLLGIPFLLPKSLSQIIRPKSSMRISGKGSAKKSFVSFDSMLEFEWQVAVGEKQISLKEFQKMVDGAKGLVKINDQYVYIDEKELADLMYKLQNPPQLNDLDLLKIALSQDYKGAKIELDKKAQDFMQRLLNVEQVQLPQALNATLRPYQLRGYEWLYKNASLGFGSLLADDMGLGKTLQVIAFLLKWKQEGRLQEKPALIVLPTTLITNWQKEIEKFAPQLQTGVYHGSGRELKKVQNADVILTSYGVVRSDITQLSKKKWSVVAIDEAQNIKNINTEQTKAVKKLKANALIAMSGTPVENKLSEYWSIFDFANKGYLDTLKHFEEEYVKPIELDRSSEVLEKFKKVTAPFILRRVKTDKSIIADLPEKIESDKLCQLTAEQTALYQSVLESSMQSLDAIEEGNNMQRTGLLFKMMIALKQICNHPSNYLKYNTIDPALSGKTQLLLELLNSILDAEEKVLIFTQYKEMGDLLIQLLEREYGIAPLWLHGSVSRNRRDELVEMFQQEPQHKVMLLSLKAGGTGLNLTQANHVIHYDLWWNPAVENQATDRAFRIGQKKNVMVYRFITQNTFEERINEMIKHKKELADLTVIKGENWIGDLSNAEIKDIFRLG